MDFLKRYFPILTWGRDYHRGTLSNDVMAAIVVTIMLIPQSLAYALLAGLPPEAGIYASIVPIMLYSIFGTSRALAVGPVAIISLLTASAIGQVAAQGTAGYATAALTLALLSGGMLLLMGVLRLGFLANLLSHPVIAGFITASGILITFSQIKHLLGISANGHTLPDMAISLLRSVSDAQWLPLCIGLCCILFLLWVRKGMKASLMRLGLPNRLADFITKAGPVVTVFATTALVWSLDWADTGLKIVGSVPQKLPPFTLPDFAPDLIEALFVPALLITIIGFVESVSVAQTLAAKKRQRIDPNQELIGLGAANIGAAFTGGYPVTGGFARSVVNFDAGAETPAAGFFTAIGLGLAAISLTPLIYYLPIATLAATIIVAVLSLVDFSILKKTWHYSKADFSAVSGTILVTLLFGVEIGITTGVGLSIILYLYKTARPHVAEVGLVPGTQHFRNIQRVTVDTDPGIVSLRIDESLTFMNARYLEDLIQDRVAKTPNMTHVILLFSAVNHVDYSALESLEATNLKLKDQGIGLHLSEVKGPVMDKLKRSHFLELLNGDVYLTHHDAWTALSERVAKQMALASSVELGSHI